MKKLVDISIALMALLVCNLAAQAQNVEQTILITNAKIFDGSDKLVEGKDVLIKGNKIAQIAKGIVITQDANSKIIDAQGRTLTPGFMDMHAHPMLQMSFGLAANSDEYYWAHVSAKAAEVYLANGYTTVRDVGGNSFSLKKSGRSGTGRWP